MLVMIKETVETPIGTYMKRLYDKEDIRLSAICINETAKKMLLCSYKRALDELLEAIERS